MDPELSFIQANLVKANRGAFTLDPFCGTGMVTWFFQKIFGQFSFLLVFSTYLKNT